MVKVNMVPMDLETASRSFFPWNWAMITWPAPLMPMLKFVQSMMMLLAEDTPAIPSVPIKRPTITVSTTV